MNTHKYFVAPQDSPMENLISITRCGSSSPPPSSFDEWLVFCNKLVMAAADLPDLTKLYDGTL